LLQFYYFTYLHLETKCREKRTRFKSWHSSTADFEPPKKEVQKVETTSSEEFDGVTLQDILQSGSTSRPMTALQPKSTQLFPADQEVFNL